MASTPVSPNLNATAARNMSPEQHEQHRQRELARREEFNKEYPTAAAQIDRQIRNSLPPGTNPAEVIVETQGRNEEEDEKLSEVRKVHKRMAEAGTIPATIVWLHPWPGQAHGRYLMYSDMTVEACPIGQAYSLKVIRQYKIDLEDKGGRFGADVVTPIALANDFVQQFFPQKQGGCFKYLGDHLPGERDKSRADDMKAWDKAKKEQLAEYRRRYSEAEGFFHQGGRGGLKNITENHRLIAQWLLFYRYISALPTWVSASMEPGDAPDLCPRCGADAAGGFACGNCAQIIDPFRAYAAGEIEDDHHSLRKLTRDQLNELGLDYVPTMEEYRAQRREDALALDDEDEVEDESGNVTAPTRRNGKKRSKRRKPAASLEAHLATHPVTKD